MTLWFWFRKESAGNSLINAMYWYKQGPTIDRRNVLGMIYYAGSKQPCDLCRWISRRFKLTHCCIKNWRVLYLINRLIHSLPYCEDSEASRAYVNAVFVVSKSRHASKGTLLSPPSQAQQLCPKVDDLPHAYFLSSRYSIGKS